ncbi:hypothetical protein SAMD00023353_0400710 [Rosellinia necatrix]|uniref:Ecp2 effector protein-like domain-containing protein n=1 Tax=Rosellinia necatrix TaxID=77044 RepID=A0A1S7UJ95_ROSNE|nr:hypothetical protein SAMD00023353_0400710 [Rosellinia necatrix]
MRGASRLTIFALALSQTTYAQHVAEPYHFESNTGVCGDTTWENRTSSNPAFAESCESLASLLREDPNAGFNLKGWVKNDSDCRAIASQGDCAFEVMLVDPEDGQVAPITQADMADLLQGSMKFASGDYVGASGVMDCNAGGNLSGKVFWRVYGALDGSTASCQK